MATVLWSVVAAIVGIAGTWFAATWLGTQGGERPPDVFWLLGLAALLPAWLIPFIGLLERMGGRIPNMAVARWWILSAAAAVGGLIATHARVRGLHSSGRPLPPWRYWRIGLLALAPAWGSPYRDSA